MPPFLTRAVAKLLLLTAIFRADAVNSQNSPPRPRATSQIVVNSVIELEAAIRQANLNGGHATIEIQNGYYPLSRTLVIEAPHITIMSRSGHPANVTIAGDAMRQGARIGNLIRVAGSDFTLRGITLERSGQHLIQIAGEADADRSIIRDCVLRDSFEQLLKVSLNPAKPEVGADDGLIENCLFEYSAGIGPQYYIGGIDAHGARRWVVRGNIFRNIASPSKSVAEFAIHFWSGSADNIVEKNAIIDCDRGIGFGLDNRPNFRGIIRNNIIYHSANHHAFSDVGIALVESPESIVHNNTVLIGHSYPWSIEYRFRETRGAAVFNNLSNRPIISRDGAHAMTSNNVTNATPGMFEINPLGIPRLKSTFPLISNIGSPVNGFVDDYFGQPRPDTASIDIGAEQRSRN